MQIYTSSNPKINSAETLSDALEQHRNTPVLLLLAGGSALHVLDALETSCLNEYTTIMMMDERFTSNPHDNNFLQMTQTLFYAKLSNSQCNFISSVPTISESHNNFTIRIEDSLTTYLTNYPNCTVIGLFGVGADGHTAAIFPMEQSDFVDTYGQGNMYTKVVCEKNPFSKRTSITPKFIKSYITQSFVYIVGNTKKPVLLNMSNPYELYEMPAHIHKIIDSNIFTDITLT